MRGDLATLPLRELLGWLAERRASGTLSLNRDMIARRFQLRGGRVMLSSSTDEEMLLGRLLVNRGLIDLGQLEAVLQARQGSRQRLGAALTRAGVVSATQLRTVLTDKVRRLLLDALSWSDGVFFFDDAAPLRKRAAVVAAVGLDDVLAASAEEIRAATLDATDVAITDEDIIEIVELAKGRRGGVGREKVLATVPAAPQASAD